MILKNEEVISKVMNHVIETDMRLLLHDIQDGSVTLRSESGLIIQLRRHDSRGSAITVGRWTPRKDTKPECSEFLYTGFYENRHPTHEKWFDLHDKRVEATSQHRELARQLDFLDSVGIPQEAT